MINRVGNFKLFRWSDGRRTLTLRVNGADGGSSQPPKLHRWRLFFVGIYSDHTIFAYKRAS